MIEVRQGHRRNNEIEGSALDGFQVKGDVNDFRDDNDVDGQGSLGRQKDNVFPRPIGEPGIGEYQMGRLGPPQGLVRFVAGSHALGLDELAFKGTPDVPHRFGTGVD
jgi:hypothetical protein